MILAGPKSVTLLDDDIVESRDLGTNFYLTDADVGKKTRASACMSKLAELNTYVQVGTISGHARDVDVSQYSVILLCCSKISRADRLALNEKCRAHKVGYISADCYGLAGHIFVDFGAKFTCFDKDGEEVRSAIVAGITAEADGLVVFTHNDKRHGFHDDDHVSFREVQGMVELNKPGRHYPIKVTGPYSFKVIVDDVHKFSPYLREGIVTQVKRPVDIVFNSLAESESNPVPPGADCLPVWDLGKFGRAEQLHVVCIALRQYIDTHGLPAPHDHNAIASVHTIAESIKSTLVDSVEESVVRHVVNYASCDFGPLICFTGGIIAQEVVKYTGKFHPLHQNLYFDMFEVATEPSPTVPVTPGRYHDLEAIIGKPALETLHKSHLFLVGSGALGCEFLKSFALNGIATKQRNGLVTVTDMDRIETSNLNRQFLFRSHHVGKQKSTTAAVAAVEMNPEFNCVALETRVGPDTEETFNDTFWESQDCIVNALDNIQARLYVDSRCVWYDKPLLESGTLGTKANVQVVLPHVSQSYGDSQDPQEESIPLCTLKNFPHQIEHTIEWSRDVFHGLFADVPGDANMAIKTPDQFFARLASEGGSTQAQIAKLAHIQSLLEVVGSQASEADKFAACVAWAVNEFTARFDHSIAQLIHTFPLDHKTSEGNLFWSGPKRPPTPIRYDGSDEECLNFVVASANLIAQSLGLGRVDDRSVVADIAARIPITPFRPKEMKIKADDKDTTVEGSPDDETELNRSIDRVKALLPNAKNATLTPHEFEKDDDSNFHIDFIAAAANLRARNYKIPIVDKFRVKLIAGKIIPAIATTTAMVVGLVTAELIKLLIHKNKPIELFKNSFINLALPVWILSEPLPPVKTVSKDFDAVTGEPVRAKPEGFTPWQKIIVDLPDNKDPTLQQFIDFLAQSQQIDVVIVSAGNTCLYNAYMPRHKDRLGRSLIQVYEEVSKTTIPNDKKYITVEVSATDSQDGVDVVIPSIKFRVHK